MGKNVISKKICMSEIQVELAIHGPNHFFDATAGKVNSSFGYIEKGSAMLHTAHNVINVTSGMLFYVPDGVRYYSVWTGNPEIKLYNIHIVNKHDFLSTVYHPLQIIPEFSTLETYEIFKQIYELFETKDRISQIQALGIYYQFYAKVLPLMKTEAVIQYSPTVLAAVQFVEEHYKENFSVEDLANYCHVSVSAIHHKFQTELHTTPLKFRNEVRMEHIASELRNSTKSVSEIAFENGFNSVTYFAENFKKQTSLTPSEYRKRSNDP